MPGAPFFFSVPQAGENSFGVEELPIDFDLGRIEQGREADEDARSEALALFVVRKRVEGEMDLAAVTGVDVRHRARID